MGGLVGGELIGSVVEFDDPGGYGSVVDDDGGGPWFFHCTAIRDGSRTIAVGARVAFAVVPGHQGRYEATDLRPA
jgi:cold shock CspA family protein